LIIEQITKADRDACHALCRMAKLAPHYGSLVPPFYGLIKGRSIHCTLDTYSIVLSKTRFEV